MRWDQNSESYDMGFRDYSPGLNRFLTRDSYNGALSDMNLCIDPWTGNRYAFGGGNPISNVEIDGHDFWRNLYDFTNGVKDGWNNWGTDTVEGVYYECGYGTGNLGATTVVSIGLGAATEGIGGAALAALSRTATVIARVAKALLRTPRVARLPQDIHVNPTPPRVLPLTRPIGLSPTQNAVLQQRIAMLKQMGARDFRVNQQQVNAAGVRVGVNRPDLQYTLNGQRYYVEFETPGSTRGPGHISRILANDPSGQAWWELVP